MAINTVYELNKATVYKDIVFGWTVNGIPLYQMNEEELYFCQQVAAENRILLEDLGKEVEKALGSLAKARRAKEELSKKEKLLNMEKATAALEKENLRSQAILTMSNIVSKSVNGVYEGERYFHLAVENNGKWSILRADGTVRIPEGTLEEVAISLLYGGIW